jgi:ribosomal protein S18 acetylase RimI-like enzyme
VTPFSPPISTPCCANCAGSTAIDIRPATVADGPALGRLGSLLVALHHDFDADRFIAATPETKRGYGDYLANQIGRPDVIVLAADEAGAVLGYVYAAVEGRDYMALRGPAGVVYDLIVDPARRRQGIGRRLLNAALTALVEMGAPRVVLSTADRNETAQALFASLGFRRTMIEMTWDPPRP